MPFNLDLRVVAKGVWGGDHVEVLAEAEAAPFDLGDQEERDLAAFRGAGWRFKAASAKTKSAGPLALGLLAQHPRRGLVIVRDRIVVALQPDYDASALMKKYPRMERLSFGANLYEMDFKLPEDNVLAAVNDATEALQAETGSAVRFVEPVIVYHIKPVGTLVDEDPAGQWQWDRIQLPQAWAAADKKGAGVRVAVMDDGFFESSVQLNLNVATRARVSQDGTITTGATRKAAHGTFCASLVGAPLDGHQTNGVVPDCSLILTALGETAQSTAIGKALAFCADEHADVITCSLGPGGGRTWDNLDTIREAITHVHQHGRGTLGTVVAWAMPNDEAEIQADSLESFEDLVCVAPSNTDDHRISSGFGSGLDLIAPGEAVTGMLWDGVVTLKPGTGTGSSFATPCVAGVAALVLSINPNLKWREVIDIITKESCDPDTPGKAFDKKLGWGRLNALRAVTKTPAP